MWKKTVARNCLLGLLGLLLCLLSATATQAQQKTAQKTPPGAAANSEDIESSEAGLGFVNPLQVDHQVLSHCPNPYTAVARMHTCVIFINGVDPANLGNFYGLSQFVKAHGYPQTHFGQLCHGNYYLKVIRQLHELDPQARIVLVGFSGGAYVVRNMANTLKSEGIPVDLLAYIGGDMIYNNDHSQPHNVCRILNITGHGFCLTGGDLFFRGDTLERAMNVYIPVNHFSLPSHHDTIEALMQGLAEVATTPVIMPAAHLNAPLAQQASQMQP
jgi:hypothetical protein